MFTLHTAPAVSVFCNKKKKNKNRRGLLYKHFTALFICILDCGQKGRNRALKKIFFCFSVQFSDVFYLHSLIKMISCKVDNQSDI